MKIVVSYGQYIGTVVDFEDFVIDCDYVEVVDGHLKIYGDGGEKLVATFAPGQWNYFHERGA